jgi:hypothetical protein
MKLELLEFTQSPAAERAGGIIRNVIVCGAESRNGRRYSRKALADIAALAENKAAYLDHATEADKQRKARSAADRIGVLNNCKLVEGKSGLQVRGDLTFLPTHPIAPRLLEAIERRLPMFGLSIVGDGEGTRQQDGTMIVESVSRLASVDLVSSPATCLSLAESEQFSEATAVPVDPRAVRRFLLREESARIPALIINRSQQQRRGRPTVEQVPTSPAAVARWLRR